MKKQLLLLCTTCLLMAFIPAKQSISSKPNEKKQLPLVVRSFHVVVTGSNNIDYYVTLDFNLSTQTFGVITAHVNGAIPPTEMDVTLNSGSATTTGYAGADGSNVKITVTLNLSINGTSTTLSIPSGNIYYFD